MLTTLLLPNSILHYLHYTLHYLHYTLHYLYYTLHYLHYILHYLHYTLHYLHYTLHYLHYILHYLHYTLHYLHYTLAILSTTTTPNYNIIERITLDYLKERKQDHFFLKKLSLSEEVAMCFSISIFSHTRAIKSPKWYLLSFNEQV